MKISINTLRKLDVGSIASAIDEIAREHDSIASGIIGPSFATSGPGSGWCKKYDVSDYARRALTGDSGAGSYIDASDGREATLDVDGELVWTEDSAVEIEAPSIEEAVEWPAEFAILARDAASYGADAEEWAELVEKVANYEEDGDE